MDSAIAHLVGIASIDSLDIFCLRVSGLSHRTNELDTVFISIDAADTYNYHLSVAANFIRHVHFIESLDCAEESKCVVSLCLSGNCFGYGILSIQ